MSSHPSHPRGRVLVIAGSDSGGGAGIQADVKTITMLGGYAATSITAVTVQNTLGVTGVHLIPADVVEAQGRAVIDDIGVDAVKTGMLGDVAIVEVVARLLDRVASEAAARGGDAPPAVVDPVMIAKGGAALLADAAVSAIVSLLLPRASLLTPNAPEASALTGLRVESTDDLRRAGDALLARGARAVLVKGGHVPGPEVVDVLMTADGEVSFAGSRLSTRHTHGTGCTLASACATGLALGLPLTEAVRGAIDYVREAIARAPGFGAGHGPLDHGHPLRRVI